jgi:hypothetical protein
MHGMMQKIKEKAKVGYQKVKAGAKKVGSVAADALRVIV